MMIDLLVTTTYQNALSRGLSRDDANWEVQKARDKLLQDWHVLCSVSGKPIPVPDVLYWDVVKQIAWSSPELIAENRFQPTTP